MHNKEHGGPEPRNLAEGNGALVGPCGLLPKVWFMFVLAYRRSGTAGSSLMAAAIGFYALTCFMPLGIFMVWVLGLAMGRRGLVLDRIQDALTAISPETAVDLSRRIADSLSHSDPSLTGALGVLALVWSGHRLFEVLEDSLTRVWHGRPVRSFFTRKLLAFVMLLAAAGLLGGYMLLISGVATLRARLMVLDPRLGTAMGAIWLPLIRILAGALVFVAFWLIYRFIPGEWVPARVPLLGAAVATLLWHIVAPLFSHFIGRSTAYSSLYGSMTSVVLFGLWAYTSGVILLMAAALSSSYFDVFGKQQGIPAGAAEEVRG
ncbi:MAG: YihY/virulence factor BrkB family protein [Armatimonadota bacterium]